MVASTITLHLVQCRAVGRSQAALALKAPLNVGTSGAGLLKRKLPMQGTSNPKRINLGKDFVATSGNQGESVDLVLDPSSFEHKTYEARKEFLTAYFNRRPYVSAQEKEKLAAKLWLWKADISSHFTVKQKVCEKHCRNSNVSVLLGFDMNALRKLKHDLIFEDRDPETTTVQRGFKSRAPNPDQSNSTTKPSACMETISIDSDSDTEMDNKQTKEGAGPNEAPVKMSETEASEVNCADAMETDTRPKLRQTFMNKRPQMEWKNPQMRYLCPQRRPKVRQECSSKRTQLNIHV
ncbi:hypothetical protein WMY93_016085 [Mugilogobius chulae]|uniref:Uncharacterized protein n=1 Tax=Mugilogobius chulae TaxID=88201 RepID=A0AAW0NW93_9GOBI